MLLNKRTGILRAAEFAHVDIVSEVRPATMADVLRVHEAGFCKLKHVERRVESAWFQRLT